MHTKYGKGKALKNLLIFKFFFSSGSESIPTKFIWATFSKPFYALIHPIYGGLCAVWWNKFHKRGIIQWVHLKHTYVIILMFFLISAPLQYQSSKNSAVRDANNDRLDPKSVKTFFKRFYVKYQIYMKKKLCNKFNSGYKNWFGIASGWWNSSKYGGTRKWAK
jgi:hypothetical protein